jgi:cytochrome P450 family 144
MPSTNAEEAWKDLFDPFDRELVVAPYSQYHRLRSEDPVHWSPPIRAWVLTRMEDIRAVLNDSNFVALAPSKILADLARRAGRNYDPMVRVLDAALFFNEGARHRQDRKTISKIMNHTKLSQLEPVINDLASSLASKLSGLSEYDAIAEFADPLPQYVMAQILGLPVVDVLVLSELLAHLTLIFDTITLDVYDTVNRKVGTALDLLKSRIAEAAGSTEESGLSILYGGTSGPETQRLADAAATALFAYRVGSETTTGLIGLLIRTLIRQPRLRQMAREKPSLVPTIVSEVLRLESNVQRPVRIGREARVIGGKTIQPGERVMLLLGAANRDPAAFPEPDDLRVDRRALPDVAFGEGHHFCLGASLARLEGRIALEQFLRLPPIEQAGHEKWYPGRAIRRLIRLPVRATGFTRAGVDRDS